MHGARSLTGAAVAAIALLSGSPAAGAAVPETTAAVGWASSAGAAVARDVVLPPGARLTPRVPRGPWALSFTLAAPPGAVLRITGPGAARLGDLRARPDGRLAVRGASGTRAPRALGARAWTHRVELVRDRLTVDGVRVGRGTGGAVTLTSTGGAAPVRITALTTTPTGRRDALLLHRLGDLRARTPDGRFPLGEGPDGRLRFSGGWTSGFWPGALWEAARLVPGGPYGGWALDASLARLGGEGTPIHDVGFMFGRSVVVAFERRCPAAAAATARCRTLRASGLAAADTLVRLAGTAATGMVPTDATGPEADTIVDSLMNLGLLTWATRVSGDARYAALARTHATTLVGLVQRPDGSTIQLAVHDRATGALLRRGTRQGLSDTSTWARGQAWAIYGLAAVGRDLRDAGLVAAAERAAAFWIARAPAAGPPPYDLTAGARAPRDSSAAAIAAAGMVRLARACAAVPGACSTPTRWRAAAGATLDTALTAVSTVPPLGRLGDQAYTVGPRNGSWDDRAELVWGLDFALEAVAERALSATGARTS